MTVYRATKSIIESIKGNINRKDVRPSDAARLIGWLQRRPDDLKAHLALGRTYLALKRYDQARRQFEHLVSLENASTTTPEEKQGAVVDGKIHLALLYTEYFIERAAEGEALYVANLNRSQGHREHHTRFATYLYGQSRYEEAERYFRNAVFWDRGKLKPRRDNITPLNNLGACLIASGKAEEAQEMLRAVLQLDPGNEIARDNLSVFSATESVLEPAFP